VTLNAVNRVVG